MSKEKRRYMRICIVITVIVTIMTVRWLWNAAKVDWNSFQAGMARSALADLGVTITDQLDKYLSVRQHMIQGGGLLSIAAKMKWLPRVAISTILCTISWYWLRATLGWVAYSLDKLSQKRK